MQRRSNEERTATTRSALLAAARDLFLDKGYAATSTPQIAEAAGVTRGALYHHFADKPALFEALILDEWSRVTAEIDAAAPESASFTEQLLDGGKAYLACMRAAGRTRLLLIEAPAVLGWRRASALDGGAETLRWVLEQGMASGAFRPAPLDETAAILSAAFDRAALAIDDGGDADAWTEAMAALLRAMEP